MLYSNCLFGLPNRILYDTLRSTAQEANLPITNLANDQGSADQGWQCPGVTAALVGFASKAIADVPLGAMGLFQTNLTPNAKVHWYIKNLAGTIVFDSGLIPANVKIGYRQTIFVLPQTIIGAEVFCNIDDPTNTDGFINVPLAFVGQVFSPKRNMGPQSSQGRVAQTARSVTRSGGVSLRNDWTKRTWTVSLPALRTEEVDAWAADMDLYSKRGYNVLFIPNPKSLDINKQAVFGEMESSGDFGYTTTSDEIRSYSTKITERL